MENKRREIAKFYERIFFDVKLKDRIVEKAKKIETEEDLRKLIREEIMPLMKKFKVNFSEKELLEYEAESLKKLSKENLANISGGVSVKSVLLAGGLLSVGLLSGVGLSPTTHAMQVETVSTPAQGQAEVGGNSHHNNNDNGNSNANDNENAGNSTDFKFNLQDAHYTQFRRLMNNAGNQLHGVLEYFRKNGVKTKKDILDFLENLRQQDPESFERLRSDVSHSASQIGQFGQDKILIGRWLSDNRFLPEQLQLIMDVEGSFNIVENWSADSSSEDENSDILFNNNDINNEGSRQNLIVLFADKSATESQSQNNNSNDNSNSNNNNNDINNEDNQAIADADGMCGQKVYWGLDENGTLTILGEGDMLDYDFENPAPWYEERYNIKNIVIKKGVTSIGAHAFKYLENLDSVNIPGSVTSIGEFAFDECKNLTSIEIPESVTYIGEWAFNDCKKLNSANIPEDITSIKKKTFYNCGLESIDLPDGIKVIGEEAFALNLFDSIEIPESVTSIELSAFRNCRALKTVTLPDKMTSIGNSVFSGCRALEHIDLPKELIFIKNSAFENCESLKSIYIPKNVKRIEFLAFGNCKSLKSIDVDKNNPNFTSADGVVFSKSLKVLVVYPAGKPERSYDVPANVTSIGDGAFKGCKTLEKIALPKDLNSIGTSSFRDCKNLKSIAIPDEVVSIGDCAFWGCWALTSISIPENVDFLGDHAFYDCENLKYVEFNNVKKFGNMSAFNLIFRYFEKCYRLEVIFMANPND